MAEDAVPSDKLADELIKQSEAEQPSTRVDFDIDQSAMEDNTSHELYDYIDNNRNWREKSVHSNKLVKRQ